MTTQILVCFWNPLKRLLLFTKGVFIDGKMFLLRLVNYDDTKF